MDQRLILLDEADNCLVAAAALEAGEQLIIDGQPCRLPSAVPLGHKVARRALAANAPLVKFGAVIGHVTAPVAAGAHLHTHNVASDYLPTYTHQAGQRFVPDKNQD